MFSTTAGFTPAFYWIFSVLGITAIALLFIYIIKKSKTALYACLIIFAILIGIVAFGISTGTKISTVSTGVVHESTEYGFSLALPANWGAIKGETKPATIFDTVQLTADNDPNRYIRIMVVKVENKNSSSVVDYPMNYLTENETYAYYYSGGGDNAGKPGLEDQKYFDIAKEVKAISETFKLAPLSYSTIGVPATVSKTTASFDYTAQNLTDMATECGTSHQPGYFDELVAKFSGTTETIYTFKYTAVSKDDNTFIVTLLPNKAGYTTLDQFKKDFDICAVGGDIYPTMLNSNWLLFKSSCGSGYDDGSGQPHGCDEIQKVVVPTLKLN